MVKLTNLTPLQRSFFSVSVALVLAYVLLFGTLILVTITTFAQIERNRKLINQHNQLITTICNDGFVLDQSLLFLIKHIQNSPADNFTLPTLRKLNILHNRIRAEINDPKSSCNIRS